MSNFYELNDTAWALAKCHHDILVINFMEIANKGKDVNFLWNVLTGDVQKLMLDAGLIELNGISDIIVTEKGKRFR